MNTNLLKPSVIIPAHNEEKSIEDTLNALLDFEYKKIPINIVVVCNGCTDNTVTIVRGYPSIRCEDIPKASKALAIRHAESLGLGFPRLYLDSDICISGSSIAHLFEIADRHQEPCLLLPKAKPDVILAKYLVRAFYKVWYKSPFVLKQGFGCGAYVLNEAGRSNFDEWPELISDDGFVRLCVPQNNIHILPSITVDVRVPKTVNQLIKVGSRSKYGDIELNRYLKNNPDNSFSQFKVNKFWLLPIFLLATMPTMIYILIKLVILFKAKVAYRKRNFIWHRDHSSK